MKNKMKPCPFCGAEPKIGSYLIPYTVETYDVYCANKNCAVQPYTPVFKDSKSAVKCWNKRTETNEDDDRK